MSSFEEWLSTLKVKQLKHLLNVKKVEIPTPMEKRTLLKLIIENIETKAVAEEILAKTPAPTSTARSTSSSNTSSTSNTSSSSSSSPNTSTTSTNSAAPRVQSKNINDMTNDEIKYQAIMMKQNPAQYRRQTGLNMTDEQIIAQANQLEQVAKNPAMKKQMGVMNKFMQCLNEKQRDVWNKCYSGTYIPTESEMKMLQPLLTEQRDIVQEVAASMLAASGAMTPERINQLINAAASSDPKMMVAMFSLSVTLRKWWNML